MARVLDGFKRLGERAELEDRGSNSKGSPKVKIAAGDGRSYQGNPIKSCEPRAGML